MDNTTVKKRVEYKADVAWWDVELDGTFEGKYTVRIIQPENLTEPFIDAYYNINGKVHNAVTNFDVITAVKEELQKCLNNT
jgi:hypothetical protein